MSSKILWFTGISGVGKTTLSNKIFSILKKKFKCKKIDGDIFRKKNKVKNTFSKKNIIFNNLKIINYISRIKYKYDFILVSVISPLKSTRLKSKKKFNLNYFEIFVSCNLKTLEKRDTKGLYKKAKKNLIKLIGYNSKIQYEKSSYKVIKINTSKVNIKDAAKKVLISIN